MSAERTEELFELQVSRKLPASDDKRDNSDVTRNDVAPDHAAGDEATATRNETAASEPGHDKEHGPAASQVSIAKIKMQSRLPALDDDADVGVQKEQIVTRDGKADLGFTGVLLASAAPASAPKGRWQEYRIYQTIGGKHVFSKVTRNVLEKEDDAYEADIFDPSPSSVPSQLMRSAREIARARALTWMDAAVAFFGYDPLAKALYRKLSVRFEEQIS